MESISTERPKCKECGSWAILDGYCGKHVPKKECANCNKKLLARSVSILCHTCSAVFNVDHAYTNDDLIEFD